MLFFSLKSCSPTLLWTKLEITISHNSGEVLICVVSHFQVHPRSASQQIQPVLFCWMPSVLSACTAITDKNSTYATFLVFLTTAMAEAPNTDLWIGATSVNRNQFYWTDGRPMTYRNWGTPVRGHYVFCIISIHHVLHF